jgi:lipoprotein-releasing system permease protein
MRRFELFVALRYLKARRKQAVISIVTVISVAGVAAGVAALIISLSLSEGFQEEFLTRILEATAHISVISARGATLSNYQALEKRTASVPGVVAVDPAVLGQALLRSDIRQQAAFLKGIPKITPESRRRLPKIVEGSLEGFDADGRVAPIVLGKELAVSLGVLPGEEVRAIGFGGELSPLGRMPRIQTFRVIAIFESGLWDFDSNWALAPLQSVQRFLNLRDDQVSFLEYRVSDIYAVRSIAEEVKKAAGRGYLASTWADLNRPLFSALRWERLAMAFAIGLIVLVASLNIVSTLTLMVMEKNRDIAIITAMGGDSGTIMTIFVLQGLIIGLVGTAIGVGIGCPAVWLMDKYRLIALDPQIYSIPYVPFRLEFWVVLAASAAALLISFLATLYPAWAASRLDPVEAIRYE